MSQSTGSKKKAVIGIAALAVLIAAVLIIYFVARPKPVQGAKALTIEVVDDRANPQAMKCTPMPSISARPWRRPKDSPSPAQSPSTA